MKKVGLSEIQTAVAKPPPEPVIDRKRDTANTVAAAAQVIRDRLARLMPPIGRRRRANAVAGGNSAKRGQPKGGAKVYKARQADHLARLVAAVNMDNAALRADPPVDMEDKSMALYPTRRAFKEKAAYGLLPLSGAKP